MAAGKIFIFGIGGIGKSIAHKLHKNNVNIHLFARSKVSPRLIFVVFNYT